MPAVHAEHVPAPLESLNEPPAHSSHVLCPPDDWYVPGLHSVGLVAPVEQYEPAGHEMQSSALPMIAGSSPESRRPDEAEEAAYR